MSELDLTNIAAASIVTPAAGVTAVFVDTDSRIKVKTADGTISVLNNDGLQDQNILNNGGFAIQQRVATASTAIPSVSATTRAGQVADRWAVTVGNVTTAQWAQIDSAAVVEAGLTSKYYGKITQITNAAKFILSQFTINKNMAFTRGQKVRISVKLKQFVGANAVYRLGLLQLSAAGTVDVCPAFISAIGAASVEPTWGTNLLAITPDASPVGENGTISGVALSITSTAAWVRSSAVFTVPTDAKNLVVVLYRDTLGAANDAVGIAEFQMTLGAEIVDYVVPFPDTELTRCQAYYCKTFAQGTVPVTNAGINTGEAKGVAGKAGAVANAGIIYWRFPVTMWKTPTTVTLYNPGAANALQRNLTGVADMGATASTAQLDASVMNIATGVAATAVGDQIGIHITADAEFVT
jgi:hypothetical protein